MGQKGNLFSDLKKALDSTFVSAKPAQERIGIEGWFPYYAGYSAEFVEATLGALPIGPRHTVLDPWNGSGTTTAVADGLGFDGVGFDINPVAVLVASARLVRVKDAVHCEGLAKELLTVADRSFEFVNSDPLSPWLSRRLRMRFRSIETAIYELLASRNGRKVDPLVDVLPPLASFMLLCLIRAAKRYIKTEQRSNPTWVSPEKAGDATSARLDAAFMSMVKACALDVERSLLGARLRTTASYSSHGDARAVPLDSDSVDAIVTSPPYCTRIDYFKATEFELAAMGMSPESSEYRALRERAMGTNLCRAVDGFGMTTRSAKSVVLLLERIAGHSSKASEGYYFKHFSQYFTDAQLAVQEIHRVLKPGAAAVLVVQSSYYKEIPVSLGKLYVSMAKHAGLDARIVRSVPVRKILTSINSQASKYLIDRSYTEDAVAFFKSD